MKSPAVTTLQASNPSLQKPTRDRPNRNHYNPLNDPAVAHSSSLTDESSFNAQEYIWVGTNRLPGFKTTVEFHEARLTHARKMICLFALALALPEDYFDAVTTHPGTPGLNPSSLEAINIDIGIDPHTDIQCFTLLWQDNSGGLQVLSASDEWLDARPIEGALVHSVEQPV